MWSLGKVCIKKNDEICWIHQSFFGNNPGDPGDEVSPKFFTTKSSYYTVLNEIAGLNMTASIRVVHMKQSPVIQQQSLYILYYF